MVVGAALVATSLAKSQGIVLLLALVAGVAVAALIASGAVGGLGRAIGGASARGRAPTWTPSGDPLADALRAIEQGAAPQAEGELRGLLERVPDDPAAARAHLALGYLLAARGELAEAAEVFAEALHGDPSLFGACVDLGAAFARRGNDAAAEMALVAALAAPGAREADPRKRFQARHLYGQMLRRAGRLDDAIFHLREAVALQPDDAAARDSYGAALEAADRSHEALAHYTQAARLAPDHAGYQDHLGALLLRIGQFDQAREHLVAAAALAPEQPSGHGHLAALHLRLGDWQQAQREAELALAIRPDFALAHAQLAGALAQLGQPQEAERHARRAVELAPTDADAFALLGDVLLRQEREIEALLQVRQAVFLDPRLPERLRRDADALDALGLSAVAASDRARAELLETTARSRV